MSLAVELNNAHKERILRINLDADRNRWNRKAASEAPAVNAKHSSVTADLLRYFVTARKPFWFSISEEIGPLQPTIREIQKASCGVYGVSLVDLLSYRRTANVIAPRHVSMYLARTLTGRSYPQISRATGGRDHTVAMYAFRSIKRRLETDDDLAEKIDLIKERLR